MKHGFSPLLTLFSLILFITGCGKDNIVNIDPIVLDDEDDYIDNISFDRTIEVHFSESGNATVNGASDEFTVNIEGNGITITNNGDEIVRYELSGTTDNGFLKLYGNAKQALVMDGVNITNPKGSAINSQCGKHTYVVLNGSNELADGASYTSTPTGEDEKAVLFSEGELVFSGDGSLTVNASGKSGICSDDYVVFLGGNTTVRVTANAFYDDVAGKYKGTAGVKVNDNFVMKDGNLSITNSGTGGKGISGDAAGLFYGGTVTVTTTGSNYGSNGGNGGGFPGGGSGSSSNSISSKGIKFDGNLILAGSDITVNCSAHEGIEAKGTLTISDGIVYSYSAKDDAINSGGNLTITGGLIYAHSAGNDGLDANGNCYLNGGIVFAIGSSSPEVAIDANSEGGYQLYVTNGTLIAIGGLENGSSLTQSCYSTTSWLKNTWYALTVGETTYAFKTPSSGGTPLVVSGSDTPTLLSDVTVTGGTSCFEEKFSIGASISGGNQVSLGTYTGGNGGGGPH